MIPPPPRKQRTTAYVMSNQKRGRVDARQCPSNKMSTVGYTEINGVVVPNHTNAEKEANSRAIFARSQESSRPDPEREENVHSTLSEVSTFVEYRARAGLTPIPVVVIGSYGLSPEHYANTMDPAKFLVSEITIYIENLAFCRSERIAEDLKALFGFISTLIPNHWSANAKRFIVEQVRCVKSNKKASGVLPGGEGGAIVFDRMAETDTAYVELDTPAPNGDIVAFAKTRTIVVRTNCCPAFVMSLLRSDSLLIVADWAGFHVCWDGLIAPRVWTGQEADDEVTELVMHSSRYVQEYSATIRGMGLRARHRQTRCLPCTALRFNFQVTKGSNA